MNKQEIYVLLNARNIWHEVTEHKAVFNMAQVAEIQLPYPEAHAKNLFIDARQATHPNQTPPILCL